MITEPLMPARHERDAHLAEKNPVLQLKNLHTAAQAAPGQ